jgi:hypothetical protein
VKKVFGFGVEDALVIFDPMKVEETRFGQFENKLDAVPLNNECKFVMYIELPMDPDTKVEIQRDAMSMEKGEDAQKRWIFFSVNYSLFLGLCHYPFLRIAAAFPITRGLHCALCL